jgi:hypothetical protein
MKNINYPLTLSSIRTRRTFYQTLAGIVLVTLATASAPAPVPTPPPPNAPSGSLLMTRSVYSAPASTITIGQPLPGGGVAVANGSYPQVFNNDKPDGSFGITSPIFLDQMADSGVISTMPIPANQVVTSFSSKSELAINVSTDGNALTFMGYSAPLNTLDVSNSDTPNHVDPTNSDTVQPYARAVAQVNTDGSVHVTPVNTYSGNNGRAAILANGTYYIVGNAGNGSGTEPLNVISNTGVQIGTPGGPAETTVVGQQKGTCNPPAANGCEFGFATADLGLAADKSGKDDNFRGLTIFNNTLYVTKGSGSNGVNTVYQVGTAGTLPTTATASTTPIAIVPGLPTGLARNTTAPLPRFPFGIWFANSTTLYVADEGDGTTANAATDPMSGLQKWVLTNGTWQLAYTLQNGLNLGVPYSVPNGPNGEVYPASLTPATDGLRNLGGRVNLDGTVTLYAVTSTVSASGDQGADPNQVVSITDTLSFTLPAQANTEQFTILRQAQYGEVLRGVAWSPKPFVVGNTAPTITGVTPTSGVQGSTVSMTLTGTNLSSVIAVLFSGYGVTASIQPGAATALPSSFQIPLTLFITPDADLSTRTISVVSAGGAASLPSAFSVQRVLASTPVINSAVEQGTVQSGYAVITPDPNSSSPIPTVTYGVVSGGVVLSETSLVPAQLETDALFYAEVIPAISRNLGLAITNPNSTSSQVTVTLRDTFGNAIGTPVNVSLQPQQQISRFITDLFSSSVVGGGFRGSVWLHSATGFAAAGLRFTGLEYSISQAAALTPVVGIPVRTLTAGTTPNVPLAGNTGGAAASVVPQFAMAGGWATEFSLVNSSNSTVTGRIDVFDANGNPLAVKLNGVTQSTFQYSISSAGTYILTPRDTNGQSPF